MTTKKRALVGLGGAVCVLLGASSFGWAEPDSKSRPPRAPDCGASRSVKIVGDRNGIYFSAYAETVGADLGAGSPAQHRRQIVRFNRLAGKRLAVAYVLNPLLGGRFTFPSGAVRAVWASGAVPLVSVLPLSDWSTLGSGKPDPVLSLEKLARGDFDPGLRRWARAAAASRMPLLVAFGQEVSSGWPWSPQFNGAGETGGYGDPALPDGAERFRDAFRRVVDVARSEGARNVTWLYWTGEPFPKASWNEDRFLYPGDRYVDWVGGGVYGYFPQGGYRTWRPFRPQLRRLYGQLRRVAPAKPQLVEVSVAYNPAKGDMAAWIRGAYRELASGRWPNVKLVNWWHQHYPGTTSAIDVTPAVRRAFAEAVAAQIFRERVRFACRR